MSLSTIGIELVLANSVITFAPSTISSRAQFTSLLMRNLLRKSTRGFYVYSLNYFTFLHCFWLIKTGLKTEVTKFELISLFVLLRSGRFICEELHSIALLV